jgi:hypothetical protein
MAEKLRALIETLEGRMPEVLAARDAVDAAKAAKV